MERYCRMGERIVGGFSGSSGIAWRSAKGCDGAGGVGTSTWRYHGIGVDGLDGVSAGACDAFSSWASDAGVRAAFGRWSDSLVWLCVYHFRLRGGARIGDEGLGNGGREMPATAANNWIKLY